MPRDQRLVDMGVANLGRLHEEIVEPVTGLDPTHSLSRGDSVLLDFGDHFVGYLTLELGFTGSHPDAPLWLRVRFVERLCELDEDADAYDGWISRGWIQEERLHVDVLPAAIELPRRYALRYVEVTVLDASNKYAATLAGARLRSVTSADDARLAPYAAPTEREARIDRIACRTLRNCMQRVFEDGPKRDRRLWLGDLRLQALANYRTYGANDLVKACLYLFAGTANDAGQVAACVFLDPEVEADDTYMLDYSLLFVRTLLDYWLETGDREALEDLWPRAYAQLELAEKRLGSDGVVADSDALGWCFLDWDLRLNKQAGAMGVYLYALEAGTQLAHAVGDAVRARELEARLARGRAAARRVFWDPACKAFVSGADRQLSWASQIWSVLGGVAQGEEAADLLARLPQLEDAVRPVTPYLYHYYLEALVACGMLDRAREVIDSYWGAMADQGANTFWELFDPADPDASPYGGTIVNSYCHAWSCAPAYFLRGPLGNKPTGGVA